MAMAGDGDGDGDATYRRAFSRFFHAVTARADRWPKALLRACQDFSKRMRAAESNRGHVIKERQGGGRRPTYHLRGGPGSTGSRPRCSVQQLELQSLCRRVAVNLNPFASLTQDVAVSALSPPYVYAINAQQSFLSRGVWHAEGGITGTGTGGRTESL